MHPSLRPYWQLMCDTLGLKRIKEKPNERRLRKFRENRAEEIFTPGVVLDREAADLARERGFDRAAYDHALKYAEAVQRVIDGKQAKPHSHAF